MKLLSRISSELFNLIQDSHMHIPFVVTSMRQPFSSFNHLIRKIEILLDVASDFDGWYCLQLSLSADM